MAGLSVRAWIVDRGHGRRASTSTGPTTAHGWPRATATPAVHRSSQTPQDDQRQGLPHVIGLLIRVVARPVMDMMRSEPIQGPLIFGCQLAGRLALDLITVEFRNDRPDFGACGRPAAGAGQHGAPGN